MGQNPRTIKLIEGLFALRNLLFGTWDRAIAFVSLILGLVSIFLTLYLEKYPATTPDFLITRDLFVVFGLVGIIMFLLIRSGNQELAIRKALQESNLSKKHSSNQFMNAYKVVYDYRNQMFKYFKAFVRDDVASKVTEEELKLLRHICSFITSGVRRSFIEYFGSRQIDIGDDIAVTVKLIVGSDKLIELYKDRFDDYQKKRVLEKKRWVITFYRDYETYTSRSEREVGGVRLYDIQSNTEFFNVVENRQPFFLSNDLKTLAKINYFNENPRWQDFYNATLLVPIRYVDENSGLNVCFGLLAVDSLNRKGIELYNSNECRHILSHAANLLANFFLTLGLVHFREENKLNESSPSA
jgi:hypothetical protein